MLRPAMLIFLPHWPTLATPVQVSTAAALRLRGQDQKFAPEAGRVGPLHCGWTESRLLGSDEKIL